MGASSSRNAETKQELAPMGRSYKGFAASV